MTASRLARRTTAASILGAVLAGANTPTCSSSLIH